MRNWIDGHVKRTMILLTGLIALSFVLCSCGKNSSQKDSSAQVILTDEILKAQPGDHIFYGHYEQDNDLTNGAEAIEWRVLAQEENRLLLLSEYGLNMMKFGTTDNWEESPLRGWLNYTFYADAFNAEEQKQILETKIETENQISGRDVKDSIFLLSIKEVNNYFKNNEDRQCKATKYAITNDPYNDGDAAEYWWLRSKTTIISYEHNSAACVLEDGSVANYVVFYYGAVRPAFWLSLETVDGKESRIQSTDDENVLNHGISDVQNAQLGDHIFYGHYEQDNDLTNGEEAIEWRILAREDNRLLLLSEYGLDAKMYIERAEKDNEIYSSIWDTSFLRSWLNGVFYERVFSTEEKSRIEITEVKAEENPGHILIPIGKDTKDRIFLLNIQEINTYLKTDLDRQCKVTAYAKENKAYSDSDYDGTGWWWLRSSGLYGYAAFIDTNGSINDVGYHGYYYLGSVRPALWLNLEVTGDEE